MEGRASRHSGHSNWPRLVVAFQQQATEVREAKAAVEDDATRKERQVRVEQLELLYGPKLDAMTPAELQGLMNGMSTWTRKWIGREGRQGKGRGPLLEHLADRAAGSDGA
ncbi:hypothetical protein [Caulifigura coniformis]|uniref:hypothetical protein n=1 Tax=Caulifigura coniformis TaxID=2527983 RepID=UPI0011A01D69|nr:hypothetical protein [Caulifigura coniformis]